MDYSGYVYIWYDTKAKFFYVGSHLGTVEDRYICSSKTMKRAYKLRPDTFRFRVLEYVVGDLNDMWAVEQKWLDRIKDQELMISKNVQNNTCRYYNVKKTAHGGSGKGIPKSEKWKQNMKGKNVGWCPSPETRDRMSKAKKGKPSWNKGVPATKESNQKQKDLAVLHRLELGMWGQDRPFYQIEYLRKRI